MDQIIRAKTPVIFIAAFFGVLDSNILSDFAFPKSADILCVFERKKV